MSRIVFTHNIFNHEFENPKTRNKILNELIGILHKKYSTGFIDEQPYYNELDYEMGRISIPFFIPELNFKIQSKVNLHVPKHYYKVERFIDGLQSALSGGQISFYYNDYQSYQNESLTLLVNVEVLRERLPQLLQHLIRLNIRDEDMAYELIFTTEKIPFESLEGENGLVLFCREKNRNLKGHNIMSSYQDFTPNYLCMFDDKIPNITELQSVIREINSEIGAPRRNYIDFDL